MAVQAVDAVAVVDALTVRDQFAIAVLTSMVSGFGAYICSAPETCVPMAYKVADYCLKYRSAKA